MNVHTPADNARSLTIAQLVVSIFGLITLVVVFICLVVLLLIAPLTREFSIEQIDQLHGILWITLAAFLLTLPSLITSIHLLSGRPTRRVPRGMFLAASIALVCLAPLVLLGRLVSDSANWQWLLKVINIFIAFIPLWWLLELGRLRLARCSAQRQWGVTVFSFYITLPVVVIVEIILFVLIVLLAAVWLVQQPEFSPLLEQFERAFASGSFNPQNFTFDWLPLLEKPGVIVVIVLSISLVVPVMEELLKPLGIWALVKRGLTPLDGFVAGMLCGASFALFESLFSLSSVSGEEWLFIVTGRAGTGLLHLTLTGFNGWALASSWKDGKTARVALTYILTVFVHGAWNLFAMVMGLSMTGEELHLSVSPVLSASAPWVLGSLALGMLVMLMVMNWRLRRAPAVSPSSAAPPPLPAATRGLE